MYEHRDKLKENKSRAVPNAVAQIKGQLRQGYGFQDNRKQNVTHNKNEKSGALAKHAINKKEIGIIQRLKRIGVYITNDSGNVRDGNKNIIGEYDNGDRVTILNDNTRWFAASWKSAIRKHVYGTVNGITGWIKEANIGDACNVIESNKGRQRNGRLWSNQTATFSTANARNGLGDSRYVVNETGYIRYAPVNTQNAPDQVYNNHPDSYICYIPPHSNKLALLHAREIKLEIKNGWNVLLKVMTPTATFYIPAVLTPTEGYNVFDFQLVNNSYRVTLKHIGHSVILSPSVQELKADVRRKYTF